MNHTAAAEAESYAAILAEMLDGIRNASHGLSDTQARRRPTQSELSISGVIKHVTWVMRQATPGHRRSTTPGSSNGASEFMGSFQPNDAESLDVLLADFDATREVFLAAVRSLDPAAQVIAPPQPWYDILEPTTVSQRARWADAVAELARHAGHADIIREQIDSATAGPLRFAVEGRPGNAFIQPWSPSGVTAQV